jgi:hypothetical protein
MQQQNFICRVVDDRGSNRFVKNGFIKNGELNLAIVNKSRAFNFAFEGNKKTAEVLNNWFLRM